MTDWRKGKIGLLSGVGFPGGTAVCCSRQKTKVCMRRSLAQREHQIGLLRAMKEAPRLMWMKRDSMLELNCQESQSIRHVATGAQVDSLFAALLSSNVALGATHKLDTAMSLRLD